MSRAIDYLATILTPAQVAEFKRQRSLDIRDNAARKKWLLVKRGISDDMPNSRQDNLFWLQRLGYVDADGRWTGLTRE